MKLPKTLQQAVLYFGDPDKCFNYMVSLRWPNGVECPACGRKDVHFISTRRMWECKGRHPRKQFSVKVGTIWEDSPISIDKWLIAAWMMANCKNGVSSYEIARTVGVTQRSAWFVMHRIREAIKNKSFCKIGSPDGGPVEVDETWVGGKSANMHNERRLRYEQSGGHHGKTVVMGMLDRDAREIRAKVVPNVKRETLQNEVLSNVKFGTKVYTDSAPAYDLLHWRYIHDFVNHAEKYVEGQVHTNGLENFWSLFKRNLRGTYVSVEPFHLERYLDEQMFRFNNRQTKKRHVTDFDRFNLAMSQIIGKRLTYAELTGKVGAGTPF
jgi:transposase-like protein